jgi:hypothetical protein
MKPIGLALAVVFGGLGLTVLACSGDSTGEPSPGATADSGASSSSGGDDAASSSGGDSGEPPTKPPVSTTEGDVVFTEACPAFSPCGGAPSGTYDYESGCLGDIFAQLKEACPAIDFSGAKITVAGSLYFMGNALARDVVTKASGDVVVPAQCAQAAGGCPGVEALLKNSFDTVSCTGATACTCTVSRTDTGQSATTFTVSGDKLTTADGESYDFCENAGALEYQGETAGAEDGVWKLKKR